MTTDVCIATSYTEDLRYGACSAMTIRHYARRHGMACEIEPRMRCERPPAWRRVKLIEELFDRGHAFVLWLDADALFCRFDVDIRTVIRPGADLYLVSHCDPRSGFGPLPNTGLMLLRNCAWSRKLLSDWWGMTRYVDHMLWDNAALMKLMGHNAFLQEGPDTPDLELLSRVAFLPETWNALQWYPVVDDPVIKHFAGIPHAERELRMPLEATAACFRALEELTPATPPSSPRRLRCPSGPRSS